jgi:hypothetical protein
MQPYDRSSKWLIEHHGDAILRLRGLQGLLSWRAAQAEVVQPRQLPDGLIEARLAGHDAPVNFLIEIATYPDRRLLEQVRSDVMLVFLDRGVLPELVTLVLHPHGTYEVESSQRLESVLRWTSMDLGWQVVNLWTLPAEDLLAWGDVGVVPWATLARYDGPPEPLLRRCRERIDQQAPEAERANLLAVTQVLARLRYNDPALLAIFGGRHAMIESPLIQELLAENTQATLHTAVLGILEARFGTAPLDLTQAVNAVTDQAKLRDLVKHAAVCPDLDAFRTRLSA